MVFVVGFSVDFVAHVAMAYQECSMADRTLKATHALSTIGVSVFWGMGTTVGAAMFLIFCVMVPFSKVGLFLIWDQVISFLVAVVLFPAALMLMGPTQRYCELR